MGNPREDVIAIAVAELQRQDAVISTEPKIGFREFLPHWTFIDQESRQVRTFADLWPGQEILVDVYMREPWVFALKARKLGFSELECAWDGYVATQMPRSRVHLFSRREDAAADLKNRVEFGVRALPDGLRPRILSTSYLRIELGSATDKRTIQAYPTGSETAVEQTCNHGHVDEFARMGASDSERHQIWQAIRPTMAGSCHFMTTGRGPLNAATKLWYQAKKGVSRLYPVFVPYHQRPGRDAKWYEQTRADFLTETSFKQEYPSTEADALRGDSEYWFLDYVEGCYRKTASEPLYGQQYWHGWDIAEDRDHAVGIVLDRDAQVVYGKKVRIPYRDLKPLMEQTWVDYPGMVQIEKNGPGAAIGGLLDIPIDHVKLEFTSGVSKPRIIGQLRLAVQEGIFGYDPEEWPWLDEALRGSHSEEEHTADAVIAAAEALDVLLNGPRLVLGSLGEQFRRYESEAWDEWNPALS